MKNKKLTVISELPIFPLPNTVFFPKTLLPLYVFEKRYREMVEDALVKDSLIVMVLLKEGWEDKYFENPPVYDIACVGKIQKSDVLSDGKYNIVLYGMQRVKILNFVQDKPYRVAQVRYLEEIRFDQENFIESFAAKSFIGFLGKYLIAAGVGNPDDLLKLETHSLESIVNQVASLLDFSLLEKQELLEITSLQVRYERILQLLEEKLLGIKIAKKIKYVPKDSSWN